MSNTQPNRKKAKSELSTLIMPSSTNEFRHCKKQSYPPFIPFLCSRMVHGQNQVAVGKLDVSCAVGRIEVLDTR